MPQHASAEPNLAQLVRETLEEAGHSEALAEALIAAELSALPEEADALLRFVETMLLDALVGRVHPLTASAVVDSLREQLASEREETGSRRRSERMEHSAATVPPPPVEGASDTYLDLATGAVHTRPTPTWGLRRTGGDAEAFVPILWLIVSSDPTLVETVKRSAPRDVEVVEVSSMAVLKGALARGDGPASAIVLDAGSPSIPFDRALAAVVEDAASTRVLLWRMDQGARVKLADAVPLTRTWLACEAEVTPPEIVQLLGA